MRLSLLMSALGGALCLATSCLADPAPQYSADDFVAVTIHSSEQMYRAWCIRNCGRAQLPVGHIINTHEQVAPPVRHGPHPHYAPTPPRDIVRTLSAADVIVSFVGHTDQLTPQGKANLVSVATALNGQILDISRFEIDDFVEVSGSEFDRFVLTRSRAEAVKRALVRLGVAADRLQTDGYGAEHLADPEHPSSAINRRVAIRLLE